MARHRGAVGAGVLLGLLVLAGAGRADEATAVKAIEKLRGRVTRDDQRTGKPVVDVDLTLAWITDVDLKQLKELKHLQSLELGFTEITDKGLKELKHLKCLQTLDLTGTRITDVGLKELKE